jgi:hypothetical protein
MRAVLDFRPCIQDTKILLRSLAKKGALKRMAFSLQGLACVGKPHVYERAVIDPRP